MFSPLAFPGGAIVYDLTTSMPPSSHLSLSPFDLYREPLSVIAVADGSELHQAVISKRRSPMAPTTTEQNIRALYQELEDLRDTFSKALVHHVLIFDYVSPTETPIPLPEGIITVPPPEHCKRTTMKTIMCDVSSLMLAEMTTLAKSFEGMTVIDSPGQASGARGLNGLSAGLKDAALSRRNSQHSLPTNSRSSSTSGMADRAQARMSMPPMPSEASRLPSSSSMPGFDGRPSTPVRSGLSTPPTTFDEISGGSLSDPSTPQQNDAIRSAAGDQTKSTVHDRVSVQGFGPGSMNERWRNKGRGRVLVILGSLYLQAGRWSDALKELSEGAIVARSINDHIWHGKALELIVVSLLLLSWSKIEFQVPAVCLPLDKAGTASVAAVDAATPEDPAQPKYLRNFQVILPDLVERVTGLYSRISAEHLPPLPLAEVTIRFCKLLSALHLAEGKLNESSLEMMVLGHPPQKPLTTSPRLTIAPSRPQIVNLLFKAFPSPSSELLTIVDRATILAGIASVLASLGHQRKKAMVIRELVSVLIGGLVEARTRGAAEVGIHPAAGLVALNAATGQSNGAVALELGEGDVEQGVDAFLGLLCRSYGIVTFDTARGGAHGAMGQQDDTKEATIARIQGHSATRYFGFTGIKLNILRACINFAEALPDFHGVMKFSSDLLRSAGSGIAPGPRREDASACIGREEQVRLVTNIIKTSHLSRRLGLKDLNAEYWDEFLVRGISLDPLPSTRTPVPHAKNTLPGATTARNSQDVNPFIYNPFLKQPDKTVVEHLVVAHEPATFKITLQNPFDIEVEIENLRLDSEGVEFESFSESLILGPYRTQAIRIGGVPKEAGALAITGVIARIHGCRERGFPIFKQTWTPEREPKVKTIGLGALDEAVSSAIAKGPSPTTESIGLSVIDQQPIVVVKSTTLPQSSVMILEGERQAFSVTLENLSTTTSADFILFSFEDSTQKPLQAALNKRDATPAELYEYQYILMKRQALRKLTKTAAEQRHIAPGCTATFDFEILGKPGLTSATMQIDYAHLGVSPEEIVDKFHTRRVPLHLTVTVNASVELVRLDVLPIQDSVALPSGLPTTPTAEKARDLSISDDYCLMTMDIRNAWPSHMQIDFEGEEGAAMIEQILPGNTTRVMIPVRRIFLDDPHASIPTLNSERQRQFVVSSSKISPDMERANREAFWYREKILHKLSAKWKTVSGPKRSGFVELRNIRLTPRMLEAVKVDEVGIEISVENTSAESSCGERTQQSSQIAVDQFVKLRVEVSNRTAKPIYPLLRLTPALCHRTLSVALDYTRKFAWNGTLQRTLPLLAPRSSTVVELGVTALCRGEFEISASVEEFQIWQEPQERDGGTEGGRPRSDTQSMLDAALGPRERRMWHSRRPCLVTVRDPE